MSTKQRVLITGAAGNLGDKLRRHLEGRYDLVLLDRTTGNDLAVVPADLSVWGDWVDRFNGIDTVVHLAADPTAQQKWQPLIAPNMDALIHVFNAAVARKVRRVVYASSNHVMGGYAELPEPWLLTPDTPPLPGAKFVAYGEHRDSTPYASAKLFGERLGKCLAESHGLEVIAVRLGWIKPGDNLASAIPPERGDWFRLMWISNRDYCHLMERCLLAKMPTPFAIVHGMSNNTQMRWDLSSTRGLLGYEPQDDVTQ